MAHGSLTLNISPHISRNIVPLCHVAPIFFWFWHNSKHKNRTIGLHISFNVLKSWVMDISEMHTTVCDCISLYIFPFVWNLNTVSISLNNAMAEYSPKTLILMLLVIHMHLHKVTLWHVAQLPLNLTLPLFVSKPHCKIMYPSQMLSAC